MLCTKIVKWMTAGALALAVVPAVGLARHASDTSVVPLSMSAVGPAAPLSALHAPAKKLSVHKKVLHKLHILHKRHAKLRVRSHKPVNLSSKHVR